MTVRKLSKELQNKAIQDLNEDPTTVQDQIKLIRTWAEGQSHLKMSPDDQWLINFLRRCKFDLDVTKERINVYLTLKSRSPELYGNRDPFLPEIQTILNMGIYLPLPKMSDPTAPRVALVRVPKELFEITDSQIENAIKLMLMTADMFLNEDDSYSICGGQLIVDCAGLEMHHIAKGTVLAQKFYVCLQTAYSLMPRSVHVVNAPVFIHSLIAVYKSMITDDQFAKLHFYGENNIDELYETIPRSILPEEYGGSCGSVHSITAEVKKKIESYKDWFLEDAQYCSDETKRVGGMSSTEGLGASFFDVAELD